VPNLGNPVLSNASRSLNKALLGSVSMLVLMLAGGPVQGRGLGDSGVPVSATAAVQQAAVAAAQQAAAAAAQAQLSIARARASLEAARAAQNAAAAASSSSVKDGLTIGGLMPSGGTAAKPLAGIQADLESGAPTRWIGADLPVETKGNGPGVTVDIKQTQQKALLTWDTFNVGANTTLNFNQSASDWIAFNRVGNSTAPSEIFGRINAPGAVYVINGNGIIFGSGSQVNIHTLVASSLDVGQLGYKLEARNQFYFTAGIANLNAFSVYDPTSDGAATSNMVAGDIVVRPGASITSSITYDQVALGSPGNVYLFGANVFNGGRITVPSGEVGLVAARAIDLVPNGFSVLPDSVLAVGSNGVRQMRGTEFRFSPFASSYQDLDQSSPPLGYPKSHTYLAGTGVVSHQGLIETPQGVVIMNGDRITVDSLHADPTNPASSVVTDNAGQAVQSVISADISIARNSLVLLRAVTSIDLNGVISAQPYDDGSKLAMGGASGSTVQSFLPAYIEMSAQGTVTLQPNALVSAPSAYVSLRAIDMGSSNDALFSSGTLFTQGALSGDSTNSKILSSLGEQILLDAGATIDVAGLQNVDLPASYNFISFQPRGGEFADMPLQRNGVLFGKTLWIDIRASGTRSDGTTWVGTPLADASGYVANVGRSITQLMTIGGTLNLSTDLTPSSKGTPQITQRAGSVVNVAGGSVNFQSGTVPATPLLGIDGRIYSMANADPNMIYLGIAGQFTVDHSRWGAPETWSMSSFVPGYGEGHDAGSVIISTVVPLLQGTMLFGSTAGERQVNAGQQPSQGSLKLTTPSDVLIGAIASANFVSRSQYTTTLSAETLSDYGLSALTVTANDFVVSEGATLRLAAGAKLSASVSGAIDIAGNVQASGGVISLTTDRYGLTSGGAFASYFKAPTDSSGDIVAANIYVEGTLDVSGRFVNDVGRIGNEIFGPGFIDGGSISLTTKRNSVSGVDVSGGIKLAAGSLLDVSSGGYISRLGKAKKSATGVMSGNAGSISLLMYQGVDWIESGQSGGPVRPSSGAVAELQLDGTLRGYGFKNNGSLTLALADTIRIGGSLQPGEVSSIRIDQQLQVLPVSLLADGGFGNYTLISIPDGWSGAQATFVLSEQTQLNLQQKNLSSVAVYDAVGTGSKLTTTALLPDSERSPLNITIRADNVVVDQQASIITDPKAKIVIGGSPSSTIFELPAANVLLLGSIIDHGGSVSINATKTWLGREALVDLSGTLIDNFGFAATNGPRTSGTVIAGGSFSVEAALLSTLNAGAGSAPQLSGSYVVAEAGAKVDVSGYAGSVDVRDRARNTSPVWMWSDAGSVSLDTGALLWGGSFIANGGFSPLTGQSDARANNGTIILGGGQVVLRRDAQPVLDALSKVAIPETANGLPVLASNSNLAAFSNQIVASIYRTDPASGSASNNVLAAFDNVYLYSGTAPGGAARIFTDLNGDIYGNGVPQLSQLTIIPDAAGAFTWTVANRLHIAASAISVASSARATVTLAAPYVELTGGGGGATAGTSSLTVNSQMIDIEGASFQGFNRVALQSSGDIRLSTMKVVNGLPDTGNIGATLDAARFAGQLDASGDILLSGQRIYPVSAVDFSIKTPGNVTFAAPAGSDTTVPLSAGGSLTVWASSIDQTGNLFAPLGRITLGNLDASVSPILTSYVNLTDGSLTSITLADTVVPYGATDDGTGWYYNASLKTLAQPPSKGLVLAATDVRRSGGSTIDLRGGGDLQATEWVQGKGGSRDTLAASSKGQTVYALVPVNDPVAAYDIHFATARSATSSGDNNPLVGTQITIEGGSGIPAGTYTLYPAHYATLPGAMRVVYYRDNTAGTIASGARLLDGTVLVTGHYTQSTSSTKQSSGMSLFAVQTNAVWQQYSEYAYSDANSYFTQMAAKHGDPVPRLPVDAGRLSVAALRSIVLDGTTLTQPGRDVSGNSGRGGELDVTAPQLAVFGHSAYLNGTVVGGYVGLDINQLNGFESVLIGGQRTDTATGTLITPGATSVLVDTRGEAFTAPEILLVAKVARPTQLQTLAQDVISQDTGQLVGIETAIYAPSSNSGNVVIASGSVITTVGTVGGAARNYYFDAPKADFASSNGKATTAQDIANALGGSLDASGTVITGADISKLSYFVQNADGSFVTNPDGSIYRHTGGIGAVDANALMNYSYQTTGLGALFVATNDSRMTITGPAGVAPASLTIRFAPTSDPHLLGSNAQAVLNGGIFLPADAGRVYIENGVRITSNVLTLQATASVDAVVGNSGDLHLQQLNVTARTIALGSPSLLFGSSLALYNQQFADVRGVSLKALTGEISLYGDFNPGAAVKRLTLDAAAVINGGARSARLAVDDGTIELINTTGVTTVAKPPSGGAGVDLTIDAQDIVFRGGSQSILGYHAVNMNARDRVLVAGPGKMTIGDNTDVVDLRMSTPAIFVATASGTGGNSFALSTLGNVSIDNGTGLASRPADSSEIGGSFTINAAGITIGSTIQAQAGTIKLAASSGDVTLGSGAYLAAGGFTKTLVDVDTYVTGGKVVLQADAGNIVSAQGSVIDVAQPVYGYGYGGEIRITALSGTANLAGTLLGGGGPGLGGRFKLDIKGAAELTTFADSLLLGGLTGVIDIHTRTGNLVLAPGHTLKANAITLTADDTSWDVTNVTRQFGQIVIGGRIDASGYGAATLDGTGQAGGNVALYAANQVKLAGSSVIDASTMHADERGGDVTIGIAWAAAGKILLQSGAQIDVSGGTKGGLSGGTLTLRAPRDGNNDVKIAAIDAAGNELPTIDGNQIRISGARAVNVEGYLAFDAAAGDKYGIDGRSLGWNGIIDPAGYYNADGTLVTSGSWTNVAGWKVPSSWPTNALGFTSVPAPAAVTQSGGSGQGAFVIAVMGLMANAIPASSGFNVANPGLPANSSFAISFPAPAGGTAAQGTATTDASGRITVVLTNPGSGYTSVPTTATINGVNTTVSGGRMQIVSLQLDLRTSNGLYDIGSTPTATLRSGGTAIAVRFVSGTGFSGQSSNASFTPDTNDYIPLKSSGVYSAFDPANPGSASFTPANTPGTTRSFFADILVQATQGTWSYTDGSGRLNNYGFAGLYSRLQPLVGQLGADVVHVKPGVELVNSAGAITVKDNWNLASGTAGNLKTATNANSGVAFQYFDPTTSYVAFNYRLNTPWSIESGALTLRAAGDINVQASISDGFFQFANNADPDYLAWAVASATANPRTIDASSTGPFAYYLNNYSSSATPIAPYKTGVDGKGQQVDAGNSISPTSLDLAASDLFPNTLNVCTSGCSAPGTARITTLVNPSSWSYQLTAGADAASANPLATISLANAQQGSGKGSVIVSNHTSYQQTLVDVTGSKKTSVLVNLPTLVRTGTGNININAALDVILADTTAPGAIYAAGVNTAKLADPHYFLNGSSGITAANPDGFLEPRILAYGNNAEPIAAGSGFYTGPATAAAFPHQGGDVEIDAQRDIVGYSGSVNTSKALQYFQPWLLSEAGLTPVTSAASAASVDLFGAGVFSPFGTKVASQTAWWIQYGSFQRGILSAGGNVAVSAGRDLIDVSVSLPTTGRVSGGLSANSTPVTHLYGSGNMEIRAGGNILGGSFYEGSGHATIIAASTIGQNGTITRYAGSTLSLPDVPLLAVDTGQITMTAGSIKMSGVVNPAGLHAQSSSFANPINTTTPLYMVAYGPDSKVRLVATTGDLTITVAPTAIDDRTNQAAPVAASNATYPASFEAIALGGNLVTTGISQAIKTLRVSIPTPGIVLSPSAHGTFELLAQGNVDLTFGYPKDTILLDGTPRPFISAGPSLMDAAFDPFQPNNGFDDPLNRAVLAHQDDVAQGLDTTARIYAAAGDILATGSYGKRHKSDSYTGYQRLEINRPADIYAGRDIVDLNLIVQNIHPLDVSSVRAGRDIYYTGWHNAGGLQVAGPGYFLVQAGGDIGPFLPAAHNLASQASVQEGIASVGNASTVPVGGTYVSANTGGSVGLYDAAIYGPTNNPRRNALLTEAAGTIRGADIVTMFGVKYGIDYGSVIDSYVATAVSSGINLPYTMDELRSSTSAALSSYLKNDVVAAYLDTPEGRGALSNYLTTSAGKAALQQLNYDNLSPSGTAVGFDRQKLGSFVDTLASSEFANVWSFFRGVLPRNIQDKFFSTGSGALISIRIDQLFFAELKAVGIGQKSGTTDSQRGYRMIETMFPSSYGYTANALGRGANGASRLIKTGDLNLLHATIQTQLGGDISIFGPGGSILVGPLATESNANLKLRDLGILSLGGGAINTFTDENVMVNSSRILTTQGGDILMWSSNGDLDAGRGSKTTLSQPPLLVQFDVNDYQRIDLGGFVSGAGIGTLQSSSAAEASNLYLLAPRGTIDFGDAGVRASGDAVFFAPVMNNTGNIQVQGTSTGIPTVSLPSVGAMTTGSNSAGAAAKSAEPATASGGSRQASIFIVEVIGYGGGSEAPLDGNKTNSDDEKQ